MITNKEKDESIAYILEKGLQQPQKVHQQLLGMFRQLGLRYLFWDNLYTLFFTILTFGVIFLIAFFVPTEYRLSLLTIVSPLLYLVLVSFAEISERLSGLYDLKQTFHFTFFQLTTFQILGHAFLGFLCTLIWSLLALRDVNEWFIGLSLSFISISLCAFFHLLVVQRFPFKWNVVTYSFCSLLFLIGLPFFFGFTKWEQFLRQLSFSFLLVSGIVLCFLVGLQMKKMLQEVQKHANAQSSFKKIW